MVAIKHVRLATWIAGSEGWLEQTVLYFVGKVFHKFIVGWRSTKPFLKSLHCITHGLNCAVCHGDAGDGNGTLKQLNPMYGFSPSLLADQAKGRSDGYIWGMIRNGRGLMPPYNRIEEADRWDVVNYVRGLQGKLDVKVETGPVGLPGETGDKLPGATRTGPTVPVKYAKAGITPTAIGGEHKSEGRP